ncbi:MAG: alpha-ketoglutarate-dependent dioxygenase AlkB [Sphingobium sp.]
MGRLDAVGRCVAVKDLFSPDQTFEVIPMPDADVSILRDIAMPLDDDAMLRALMEQTSWRQEAINLYGKSYSQPRLCALYGDAGRGYDYSGLRLGSLPWTDLLKDVKRRIEDCTDASFNTVLLNLYRDNNDSMGFHSDDEHELGPEPVIASLSFGETRIFRLKHKTNKTLPVQKIPLTSGTVLRMKGKTQHMWKHGIAKQTEPCGPRINLTFRSIYL